MTKKELVAAIAGKADTTQKNAERDLNALMEVISETLGKGEEITLVGFGTFKVKERAARKGRNPQTGEQMEISAKKAPVFKAGKALKDAVKNS